MITHLKERQYYEDLYDKFTIEQCLSTERILEPSEDQITKPLIDDKGKEYTKEEKASMLNHIAHLVLWFEKGERYLKRDKQIKEWMDADRKKDEMIERAQEPKSIRCKVCLVLMKVETKMLDNAIDRPERVQFIFRCSVCQKGKLVYESGQEVDTNTYCPKCNTPMDIKSDRKGYEINSIYSCPLCKHSYEDVFCLSEFEKNEQTKGEREKYQHDRKRFCMQEKEGEDYRKGRQNLEELGKLMEEFKNKDKQKELNEKMANIEQLPFGEVKKRLKIALDKAHYGELNFKEPEMGKHVFVGFTTVDEQESRKEYDSRQELKKLIQETLKTTNWRLASDGIKYRMGFLSGRLRAYEREEEVVDLIKKELRKFPSTNIS